MTALERMAKALAASMDPKQPWEAVPDHLKAALITHSRAALTAIREPSDGMAQAASRKSYQLRHSDTTPGVGAASDDCLIFGAMVDHVLNGGE